MKSIVHDEAFNAEKNRSGVLAKRKSKKAVHTQKKDC